MSAPVESNNCILEQGQALVRAIEHANLSEANLEVATLRRANLRRHHASLALGPPGGPCSGH